jgi:tRNA 2-thiouridine synthesizing protein A
MWYTRNFSFLVSQSFLPHFVLFFIVIQVSVRHCSDKSAIKGQKVAMATIPEILDVRGLLCPLPVLKARKRLQSMSPGDVLRIEATDPAAIIDVPHFCNESGNALLSQTQADGVYVFNVQKSA